jgi:hypothetical protein
MILGSTRPSILNWQVSRFDMSGTSPPCVVICARGHPSQEDAIELEKIPSLSAFWETALSARLFHRVEADFLSGCTFDLRLRGVFVLMIDVRTGSSVSRVLFENRTTPATTSIPCRYISTRGSDEHWDWAVALIGVS